MKTKPNLALAILAAFIATTIPVTAQQSALFPQGSCTQALQENARTATLWASGYLSHMDGVARAVDEDVLNAFEARLLSDCKASPQTSFLALVEQQSEGFSAPDIASDAAPSLLENFAGPSPDLAQIISLFEPTPDEVRSMFPEPMASRLIETYADMFGPRLADENFPTGPIEVTSGFTTTFELGQAPFLDELPGGFKRVLDQYQLDVPFCLCRSAVC